MNNLLVNNGQKKVKDCMKSLRSLYFVLAFLGLVPTTFAQVRPETALEEYLKRDDKRYEWSVRESYTIGDVQATSILLTSQQWHEFIWTHELIVLVPKKVQYDGALLFINGGSNKKG